MQREHIGLDEPPEDDGRTRWVDGLAVQWEEVLEFVGSKVCLDGNARHVIAQRSAQAKNVWRMENLFELVTAPEEVPLEHCEIDTLAGCSVEFERVDDGESSKRQNFELKCENGGERDWSEAATVDGNGSVVETLAQDWSPLDREMQHGCADSHQGTSAWLGWSRGMDYAEICAKALGCRGLQ